MGFFLGYLRQHFHGNADTDYDVVPAFKASEYVNQATAEEEFKHDLQKIALWSPSELQRWAAKQRKTLKCLQKANYHNFWTKLQVEQTVDMETRAYYQYRFKQANGSDSDQEDELEGTDIQQQKDEGSRVPLYENPQDSLDDKVNAESFESDGEDDNISISIDFSSDLSKDYHPLVADGEYRLQHNDQQVNIQSSQKWVYSIEDTDCNVIEELKVFRAVSSKLEAKTISDLRLLALNNIYLFTQDLRTSITAYLPESLHLQIMTDLLVDPAVTMSDRSILWCTKLSQVRLSSWYEIQKTTIPFLAEAMATIDEHPLDLIVANILHRAGMLLSSGTPDSKLEDSFIHKFIANVFENIFQSEAVLESNWANGQLEGKRKCDGEHSRFKPDYVVFVTQRSHRLDLSCAEAKTPTNGSTFPKSDLVKIGQEMRWMLNRLIREGVKQPIVGGILISGFNMHTYKMDLLDAKMYRMVELHATTIFRNMNELTLVPTIVSNLLQLKNITLATATKAKERLREKSKGVPPNPNPSTLWLCDVDIELVKAKRQKRGSA